MTTTHRTIQPDARWAGLVGVYGGWVGALFADEGIEAGYRVRSLQIRFEAGVEHAPMTVSRTLLHRGHRSASTRLVLEQEGRVRAEGLAVQLRQPEEDRSATSVRQLSPATATPPAEYRARPHVQGPLAFLDNLDILTPPLAGTEAGTSAWLRLVGSPADLGLRSGPAIACALMDSLLPVLFAGPNPPAFVPTLEFAYSFTPAVDTLTDGWCVGENRLDWLDEEACAEAGTLVSAADGRLLARQHQLRSIRRTLTSDPRPSSEGARP